MNSTSVTHLSIHTLYAMAVCCLRSPEYPLFIHMLHLLMDFCDYCVEQLSAFFSLECHSHYSGNSQNSTLCDFLLSSVISSWQSASACMPTWESFWSGSNFSSVQLCKFSCTSLYLPKDLLIIYLVCLPASFHVSMISSFTNKRTTRYHKRLVEAILGDEHCIQSERGERKKHINLWRATGYHENQTS